MPISAPEQPGAGQVGAEDAEEGAHQHHPLEADVDDAAALGHDAAQRREGERRGEAQHRGDQRRPYEHVLEVALSGLRGHHGADRADDAGRDRAPAEPALAALHGDHARRHRHGAQQQRRDRRANQQRRERDEPGQRAAGDPEPAERPRLRPPSATRPGWRRSRLPLLYGGGSATLSCERAPSPPQRAEHEHVRADDEHDEALDDPGQVRRQLGLEDRGSRLRCEVPLRSAPNSSAAATVPIAVLRPSSATAMPRKPSCVTSMSFVAKRNCQPRMSSAPGQAREQAADAP